MMSHMHPGETDCRKGEKEEEEEGGEGVVLVTQRTLSVATTMGCGNAYQSAVCPLIPAKPNPSSPPLAPA